MLRNKRSRWPEYAAIVWTAQRSEEEGIHVHAFDENKNDVINDTFSGLEIDGIDLDPTMVRVYMAQNALPHIAGRIVDILCPSSASEAGPNTLMVNRSHAQPLAVAKLWTLAR